jgi:hypothetical protein
MAPRIKMAPVGSSQWIQTERDQAAEFVDAEVEEFSYAAQNEMDWLNEHMADIFSSNPVYVAFCSSRRDTGPADKQAAILPTFSRLLESYEQRRLALPARRQTVL